MVNTVLIARIAMTVSGMGRAKFLLEEESGENRLHLLKTQCDFVARFPRVR